MSPETAKQIEANQAAADAHFGSSPDQADFDQLLTACLDRMLEIGSITSPAQLAALLPAVDSQTQRFILIELIKIDMATLAEHGQFRNIEFYTEGFADILPNESVPLDLVMEEIQLRKELGENPSQEEYRQRFPQFESMLPHLHQESEATSAGQSIRPPPDLPCQTIIDDFRLLQQLGKGAFATVYLAQQISMQRLVALKISRGTVDESQSLAQFDHTNIVRVYDQRSLVDQQIHLMYMQFHAGGTLADVAKSVRKSETNPTGKILLDSIDRHLLETSQSVPESSRSRKWIAAADWSAIVAWIGTQLASALHDAHSHGVLHRDVKPANVLLSSEGIPKLADFNVSFAGAAGRAGAAATFGGSIGYMSPEHLRAISSRNLVVTEHVSESADLYSLAVLLWELWQGHRPFATPPSASSWSDAVADQLVARESPFLEPRRRGGAGERVLEKLLRSTLSPNPADRPISGAEMAGRLRLALHPEAASIFDLKSDSFRLKILALSPWLVATLIILTPNIAGGLLNYQYNYHQVMTPEMRDGLEHLSWFVNLSFFPFGAAIIIWFSLSSIRAVQAVQQGRSASPNDVDDSLRQGHKAALVGGALWLLGGLVIPAALKIMFPELSFTQAIHLFISSLICGGVAMIYPFFGMAIASTWIYYPCFISGTMQDSRFDARHQRIMRHCEAYLLIAALIPLLGAALLISHQSSSRAFTLGAIGAGVIGLLASTFVRREIVKAWSRMSEVLSSKDQVLPGDK